MEKRVLIWDDGLNYVNYMEVLRAVDLTPVVGREAAGPCAALLLPGGGDIADRLPEDEIRTIRAYAAAVSSASKKHWKSMCRQVWQTTRC